MSALAGHDLLFVDGWQTTHLELPAIYRENVQRSSTCPGGRSDLDEELVERDPLLPKLFETIIPNHR